MKSTKSYAIAKRAVWEAYQQVKANRGSAGIDEESIAMFDEKLSRNLYRLWNRMSSGSYLPPPVKQVEIPKARGGTRKLGIPTVSDRIAQTVVKHPSEYKSFAGDPGQTHHRTDSRSDIPSGLAWIPAGTLGETGGCRHRKAVLAHPSADTGHTGRSGEAMQSGDTRPVELLWGVLSDGDAQALSIHRSEA